MTHLLSRHKIEVNGLKLGFEPTAWNGEFWGVTEFEGLGGPAAVYASGQRAQANGLWRTRGFIGGRSIAASGFCHHPDGSKMWEMHRQLVTAISRKEVPLTYFYPSGTRRTIWAARDGEVEIDTRDGWWFEWSFTMVASDPLWYYPSAITGQTGLVKPT